MFVVTVSIVVKPDRLETFRQTMLQHAVNSFDNELGCLAFDVSVSRDDPRRYILYALYDDEAAFEAHRASEHTAWARSIALEQMESYELLTWERVGAPTRLPHP